MLQWKNSTEILPANERIEISDEIADISIYLLLLCHELNLDLKDIINEKITKNELKYPVNKSRGNAKKYTKLI